jgi:hypothetical protein
VGLTWWIAAHRLPAADEKIDFTSGSTTSGFERELEKIRAAETARTGAADGLDFLKSE